MASAAPSRWTTAMTTTTTTEAMAPVSGYASFSLLYVTQDARTFAASRVFTATRKILVTEDHQRVWRYGFFVVIRPTHDIHGLRLQVILNHHALGWRTYPDDIPAHQLVGFAVILRSCPDADMDGPSSLIVQSGGQGIDHFTTVH